jgi:hypothetical protein
MNMKKILMIVLFATVLTGLSVTSSYATRPGCYGTEGNGADPTYTAPSGGTPGSGGTQVYDGVLGAMEDHAGALRIRNRAEGREVLHENDNALGMTCFDHALGLTGRLGTIFSDVGPGAAGVGPSSYGSVTFNSANSTVFKSPIYDQMYGSTNSFTTAISNVIQPQLSNHVNEFPDSISKAIGATVANAISGAIMGLITPLINAINTAVAPILGMISTFTGYMNTFKTAMSALGHVIGVPLSPVFTILMTALNTAFQILKQFVRTVINALQTAVKAVIDAMLSQINSSTQNNMSGAGPDCQRVQELWGVQGTSGPQSSAIWGSGQGAGANEFLRALEGTGRQQGTPYLSFADLWNSGGNQSLMGVNMKQELSSGAMNGNGSNSSIITRMQNDLQGTGILSGPQAGSQFWLNSPAPISMPNAGALPTSVINSM